MPKQCTPPTSLQACLQSRRQVLEARRNMPRLLMSREPRTAMDHSLLVSILDEALAIGASFASSLGPAKDTTPKPIVLASSDSAEGEDETDDPNADERKPPASPQSDQGV